MDTPPDRLSLDPASPFHDEALLLRGIGVRFKGTEKFHVFEYCVSERWIRVMPGHTAGARMVKERGKVRTLKMQGDVEVWFRA
jgi:hypothetical protein